MVCQDAIDRLSPFLDDELDPVAGREVSHHLDTCPSCAAAFARHRELSERLARDLEYHRAPDTLRARVMREVGVAARRDPGRSRPAIQPWRWIGVAAAVVVVAGGAWLASSPFRAGTSDASVREAVSGHIR